MNVLRDRLIGDGFSVEEDLDLGLVTARIYANKKIRLMLYPYDMHCYFFLCGNGSPVRLQQVVSCHALACTYTDRFKSKRSRWLRFRVPITMSVIISNDGFDEQAVNEVYETKQRYQMGNVNSMALFDLSTKTSHSLGKVGFVGMLPLRQTGKMTRWIADILECST